jgi:hypothetical protein
LSDLPFVQRVAAADATLFDLGMSHGLHLVAARHGGEFRVFSMLPSGDAAVEGAPIELSLAHYWLRVSSQVRFTARVLKSRRFVEIALADAGSPFFGGQNGEK